MPSEEKNMLNERLVKMNKNKRSEEWICKWIWGSVEFILGAVALLSIVVVLCLAIRAWKEVKDNQPDPTPEIIETELLGEVFVPLTLTNEIPRGKYKNYHPISSASSFQTELPIDNAREKPYNNSAVVPNEPEPPEPIYGNAEVPENAEMVYLGEFHVTGYDVCMDCCGKVDGITASGAQAKVGRTVAATKDFPFGTVLYIDGIGSRIVEDRGGMRGDHLDVLCEDHPACYAITGYYEVWEVVTDEMP